jgi:hypothetical protein
MKLRTMYPHDSKEYVTTVDIQTVADMDEILKQVVGTSEASVDDVPLVERGFIITSVYNRKVEIINHLNNR